MRTGRETESRADTGEVVTSVVKVRVTGGFGRGEALKREGWWRESRYGTRAGERKRDVGGGEVLKHEDWRRTRFGTRAGESSSKVGGGEAVVARGPVTVKPSWHEGR